jgi:hypothetical protein
VEAESRSFALGGVYRLSSQLVLAELYKADGHTKRAVELLERVVEVGKRTRREDDSMLGFLQDALLYAYQVDGQVKKADELANYRQEILWRKFAEPARERKFVLSDRPRQIPHRPSNKYY